MDNDILKKRTTTVIIITLLMMIAEIYYGIISHSMGLTADGFHMGTHVLAFFVTLIACSYAAKYANKTKKINALGGFSSAIFLGLTAVGIIWESFSRLLNPLSISFFDAILVAVIGLLVNFLCMLIMGGEEYHFEDCFCNHKSCDSSPKDENLNFKAAYLHIVADAMTSVLAIVALVLGKYLGWIALDPIIGVVGGILIAKWTADLFKSSSKILLDFE